MPQLKPRWWSRFSRLSLFGLLFMLACTGGLLLTGQPRLLALPPAFPPVLDPQAQVFACLALDCRTKESSINPSPRPEVLGNPAATRYSGCLSSYARNPWDLVAYRGRIYIGLGDASANQGPVPVIAYDPASNAFVQEAILDEEQIDRFYDLGETFSGDLWVPGADPREDWRWGNLYRRNRAGTWTKLRTLPRTIHLHALAQDGQRLFAGLTVTEAVRPGVGLEREGSAVAISDDGGRYWQVENLGGQRIFEFLQVKGRLYATDIFPGPGVQRWLNQEQRLHLHAPLYEYDPLSGFRRRPDLTAEIIFPDTPRAGRWAARVERALVWGQSAVYLSSFTVGPGETPDRGLYLARNLDIGQAKVRRVTLPPGAVAWDIRLGEQQLQVLFGVRKPDGRWENRVWSTQDGESWTELVRFMASTFARSFTQLGDQLYLGLGSLMASSAQGCSPAEQATGTLLRLRTR